MLVPFDESLREGLFALHGRIFGEAKAQRFRTRFDWQYLRNPFKRDGQVSSWIMTHQGDVVGHLGVVANEIKAGEHTLNGSWICDYMVAEGHRVPPEFHTLTEAACTSSDLPMGYGVSERATRRYAHLRWTHLTVAPFLVKPLRAHAAFAFLLDGIGGRRFRPDRATLAGTVSLLRALAARQSPDAGATTEQPAAFDASFDSLWGEVRGLYPLAVERTSRYLAWRYPRHGANRARVVATYDSGRLRGYAVIEKVEWKGAAAGLLTELVFPRASASEGGRLLRAAESLLAAEGVAAIVAEGFPSDLRALFLDRGFLQIGNRQTLMFFDRNRQCPPSANDSENWLLTAGDSDRAFGYPRLPWKQS